MNRPWIHWSGGPRPLPAGTVVDLHYDTGEIYLGAVIGDATFVDQHGNEYGDRETNSLFDGASWTWKHRYHPDGAMIAWIIAYRLHEPEDTAEQARRAARIDNFRKIAKAAPLDSSRPKKHEEPEREVLFRRHEVLNPPSGMAHVSIGLRQCVIGLAYRARAFWSHRLADDLTPAQRAEAHAFIRELTAIIEERQA